jgi:tetratricopeptide (TPR) repeat protein
VLSEEALILAAVVGACALLVLGVLELVWPTQSRRPRHSGVEPTPARPSLTVAPPRPAQSILPRRLVDSSSATQPAGGFAFPPPADYVPPPLPREEMRPLRPVGHVVPERSQEPEPPLTGPTPPEPIEEPVAPPAPADIAPPAVEFEPEPIEPARARADDTPLTIESEPQPIEPEPLRFEADPPRFEPEPSRREPWFEHESPPNEPEPPSFEREPPSFEAESPRLQRESSWFEPELPRLEPERARFEPEPPPLEPDPPPHEPEPHVVDLVPPEVEAGPKPIEPAPPIIDPQPQPIAPMPPSFEPVASYEPVEPPQPVQPPELPQRRRRSKISPHARPHRVLRPGPQERSGAEPPLSHVAPSAPVETSTRTPLTPADAWSRGETTLGRDTPLVERCFVLYQEKRFGEVLSVGEPALAEMPRQPGPSRETAALWSVVGLAKQALGDDDGAHAALESSIDSAAEPERSTYRRHLATLALEAAQARLARAGSHDAGDRMGLTRAAIAWTERGLAVVPADTALIDARAASHEALWQAYEQAATSLLQRQEFSGARQILHEALDDPRLPAARAAGFRGLISGTFGGEIGQLTAQAILGMQEGRESEAVGALQRAEDLLQTIPSDALPPTRRDEVDQRLWWGYAELGSRRLDAGDYEEALDPLIHALRFTSIGPERQDETRAAVVRALEGIAAVRALSIRRLAEAGSRDEAIVAAGDLHGLVKRGLELGLSEDDLFAAFARVRRLCEELGMDTRA